MRKEKLQELKELIESLKVINKKQIEKQNTFLQIQTYECELNNNQTIIREKILKGGLDGSAAIVLPITNNNEVILVVEPRVFSKRTVGIGLPAGYIEKEKPLDAALRELKEETGYTTNNIISLGGFYQDLGCSGSYNHLFLALNCKKTNTQHLDDSEYIKYFKCTYQESLELIDMKYIEGCNTIITLERAKKYMKGKNYGI